MIDLKQVFVSCVIAKEMQFNVQKICTITSTKLIKARMMKLNIHEEYTDFTSVF